MRSTGSAVAMSLAEVRAEMDDLLARKLRRGGFHPAEYWRWKDLSALEAELTTEREPSSGT